MKERYRDRFVLEQKWAVRWRDFRRAMLDTDPQIVHFSGHGTGDEDLVFEDETGIAKLVDGEALAELFAVFAEQVECVVLNACYSQMQATAIARHVNYVIGMSKAIGDRAAIEFAVGFYDALGAGRPVEFAYKYGCAAIRLAGIPEQLTPVLKKKPGIGETIAMQRLPEDQPLKDKAAFLPDAQPISVFFSYAREDENLRDELEKHLKLLQRDGVIRVWHDREISAGTEWAGEIDAHLDTADIILLLISADFLASDYCYDVELARAMERQADGEARVIPVILREADLKGVPFRKLQALPTDSEPVTNWANRDQAFADVARGIRKAAEDLARKKSSRPPGPKPVMPIDPLTEELNPFITGTPIDRPRYFFGRQREIGRIFNMLKRRPLQNAAIIGKRRTGKTSLLNYLKSITTTPPEQLRPGQKFDWLAHPETYCWIFVDFQDHRMASRERLLGYLLESMQLPVSSTCDLDYFMDVVSCHLNSPTVILMDEIGVGLQRCPELDDSFWESLRALATNQTRGNLGFVLSTPESPITLAHHTGHSSPFFNIFGYTTTLGPLTEPEARELIASSPINFPEKDVEWILEQSGRWPLLLQILCRERLFSLEEGETDAEAWQVEGLKQIAPFRYLLEER